MSKTCLTCGETFPDSTTFCPRDGSALRAAVEGDDLIGVLFCDRYVVTDLLGEGGMGSVYVASDVRLPQQVAIKVLRERTSSDPLLVARFRQEAEAASRINHDRVARVSDFGFLDDGRPYLVMEYVAGQTLKQILDERNMLDPVDAAHIASMVAEGLDAAHRLDIVHRDLKPENVMIVDDAGGGKRAKVLDFGIAKVLHDGQNSTTPGFVLGTPQWMSPEQLLGETLDARSDVYALGLLTFAMLTGQRAFTGATETGEMMARLSSPPRTLAEIAPHIRWPDGLQALFDRTLARDVGERPASATAFARELSTIVDVRAPTTSVPAAAVAPKRWPVVALSGVAVALVAAAAFLWYGPSGGEPAVTTAAALPDSLPAGGGAPVVAPTGGRDSADATDKGRGAPAASAETAVTRRGAGGAGAGGGVTGTNPEKRPPVAVRPTKDSVAQKPPAGNAGDPATGRGGAVASAVSASDELKQIMDYADKDPGSPHAKAAETVRRLDALYARLKAPMDQAYAQFYLGLAYATLGEKTKACAAFGLTRTLGSASPGLRANSDDWQVRLTCPP